MHLCDGKIVNSDHLGKYKIGLKNKSQLESNLLTKKSIEKFYLNFQPSIKMKHWLKKEVTALKEPKIK